MKALDALLGAFWWFLLIVGMLTHNIWAYAPAAFFLLLREMEEQR